MLFLLCLSILSGIATNPATKKIEFMTVSEAIAFTKDTNGFSMMCVCKNTDFNDFQSLAETMARSFKFIAYNVAV